MDSMMEFPEKRKFEATGNLGVSYLDPNSSNNVNNAMANVVHINEEQPNTIAQNEILTGKKQATDDMYSKNKQINKSNWSSPAQGRTEENTSSSISVIPTSTNGLLAKSKPQVATTTQVPKAAEHITVNITCPETKIALVMGNKGNTVQAIMKKSGCNISIEDEKADGSSRQITITGEPTALATAMTFVTQAMEGNFIADVSPTAANTTNKSTTNNSSKVASKTDSNNSNENNQAQMNMNSIAVALKGEFSSPPASNSSRYVSQADLVILCPHAKVGTLIGYKGSNVNEVMRRTGCKIQIIQDDIPEGVDRKVCISGPSSSVEEAGRLVNSIIQNGANGLASSPDGKNPLGRTVLANGLIIDETELQADKVRVIIGAKGSTISQIMGHSRCRININQNIPQGQNPRIAFTGTREQIELAKYIVEAIVAKGPYVMDNFARDPLAVLDLKLLNNQMNQLRSVNISDVQARFNVKVILDSSPVVAEQQGYEPVYYVYIVGSKFDASQAQNYISNIITIPMASMPGPYGYLPYSAPPSLPPVGLSSSNLSVPQYSSVPVVNGLLPISQMMTTGAYPNITIASGSQPHQQQQSQQYPQQQQQQQQQQQIQQQPPQQQIAVPYTQTLPQQPPYQPPPVQPVQQYPPHSTLGQVLALGQDGNAGQLKPQRMLPDGNFQQIADVKNEIISKVIGVQSATVNLIQAKSGAQVSIAGCSDVQKKATHASVVLTGSSSCVQLAAQMVQEVLVNGTGKLLVMSDVTPSFLSANVAPTVFYGNMPNRNINGSAGQVVTDMTPFQGQQQVYKAMPSVTDQYQAPNPYTQPPPQLMQYQQVIYGPPQTQNYLQPQQQSQPFNINPVGYYQPQIQPAPQQQQQQQQSSYDSPYGGYNRQLQEQQSQYSRSASGKRFI
mmetsp:Transcript_1443/g.2000  ORF Transcript_1443/g.2000 Transcript_1443/m.2000 type:complete len:901 (+) Transcript_1443:33-2735(+)